jgi:hypothetical protein
VVRHVNLSKLDWQMLWIAIERDLLGVLPLPVFPVSRPYFVPCFELDELSRITQVASWMC